MAALLDLAACINAQPALGNSSMLYGDGPGSDLQQVVKDPDMPRVHVHARGKRVWGASLARQMLSWAGLLSEGAIGAVKRRPEMRFAGIDELVARIKADVGTAKALLDLPEHQLCKAHEVFVRSSEQGARAAE